LLPQYSLCQSSGSPSLHHPVGWPEFILFNLLYTVTLICVNLSNPIISAVFYICNTCTNEPKLRRANEAGSSIPTCGRRRRHLIIAELYSNITGLDGHAINGFDLICLID
jgi:hypothetical protein